MINWDNARFFLAVARTGTLRGAAAQLDVDQATVGRRIAALETGTGALERLARAIGGEAVVVLSRAELVEVAGSSRDQEARR